ncbi:MAG: CPBP family intramembrane glutamic endopeptidase [Candidatus Korobacteraceae bacterium]
MGASKCVDGATASLNRECCSADWRSRLTSRDSIEIAMTFCLILLALWTAKPWQDLLGWLALLWIVVATWRSRQSAAALGLRLAGLGRSLWVVGVTVISAAIIVWIAWRMQTLHIVSRGLPIWLGFWVYMFWALVQQFILQDFFLMRLLRVLPSHTAAVVVSAFLFAAVHLPNPLLTIVTLVWGATACALFLQYHNLYSLGLAHGILGLCLAISVPNSVHHQMRVGLSYLRWRPTPAPLQRSQMDQMVSTDACVIADAARRRSSLHARP